METTEEENIHNAVNKALTEFSEKLKEEYRLHGFKTKEFFEVIDKIMGNFNSPQSNLELVKGERNNSSEDISKGCGNIIGKTKEGFRKFCGVHGLCPKCQEKYTKKYSKRNGIHQVGLKEDKRR